MAGSTYAVLEWGSHPEDDNDDCFTGFETRDLAEAKRMFEDSLSADSCAYVELWVRVDPDSEETVEDETIYILRENPHWTGKESDDSDWRQEIANEAGMLGGCDAYNEVMGWDPL